MRCNIDSLLVDVTIGFEEFIYNTSKSDGTLEICIKYFNPPDSKAETGYSRYEIQVDYESVNGSASKYIQSMPPHMKLKYCTVEPLNVDTLKSGHPV